ncbi:serine hydrolase domain-containing protein [Brevibacillus reuszeri]|uniref:serine hydrolase domain-containing protein n=1 Tax=Brevibacillus reuszeri TaxID=54915 RepID=UPI000CCBD8D5|nr:serine hydrolase domain-containing protein [Brevibacillus reuszeri]
MKKKAWEATFEDFAQNIFTKSRAPGLIVGLNKDGESLYRKSFGYRDAEQKLELSPDTIMGLASVTKSFTCMAIMQLQEAGKLSVHDPVITYLPELRTPDRAKTEKMTIHHFMTHSAGFPPLPVDSLAVKSSMAEVLSDENHPIYRFLNKEDVKPVETFTDYLDAFNKQEYELLGAPGQYFSYSNDSYSLLGGIIHRVSGKPYDVYVKDHILDPAGMSSSTFYPSDLPKFPDVTTLYHYRENNDELEICPDPNWEDGLVVAASGLLNSTLRDMLNYAEIFRTGGLIGNERILSEESVKKMMRPHIRCSYDRYYGYGLMIKPDFFGQTLVEHGGAIKGVAAQLTILPESGVTAVGFANLVGTPVEEVVTAAINSYAGRPVDASAATYREYHVPVEKLGRYVGRFISGEGADLSVSLEEGALQVVQNESIATTGNKEKYPLQPIGEDYFLVKAKGREFSIGFITEENGEVKAISYGLRIVPKGNK